MKEYPRRRDVRRMMGDFVDQLTDKLENNQTAFLTDVRDLMRAGMSFVDAVDLALAEDEAIEFEVPEVVAAETEDEPFCELCREHHHPY